MIIDESPLDFEIKRVFNSPYPINFAKYSGQFKIGTQIVDVLKIIDLDINADYEMNYAPVIMVRALVLLGDYSNVIYPHDGDLEFILKVDYSNPYNNLPSEVDPSTIITTYSVSLDPHSRPYMAEDNHSENMSKLEQDLLGPIEIDFQLKPKLADDLSKISVGGQFLNTTNADCLRDLITMYSGNLELDSDEELLGVNIHGTASTIEKKSIVIPHGLLLADLADYMQNKTGGIFPTGLSQFIHDRTWYIYPPYDTTGFDEALNKLVVISIPSKRYPNVEKTYLTENGITTILATGNKKIISDKKQIFDNAGNGVMQTDANNIINGFTNVDGNVSVIKRSTNNSEFISETVPTGRNNVRMSTERISSNPFVVRSRLARSQGHFYMFEWTNANPSIIEPGMHVKILYLNEGEVKEITGVLVKCHQQTKLNGTGINGTGYRSFCAMVVFVKTNPDEDSGLLGLT